MKQLGIATCDLTSQSFRSLAKALNTTNIHFEELDISGHSLGDDSIQHLAHALNINKGLQLKILNLRRCNLISLNDNFTEVLTTHKHLEDLNISYNALSDDGIQYLSQGLRVNQTLKRLNMERCNLNTLSKCFDEALAIWKNWI